MHCLGMGGKYHEILVILDKLKRRIVQDNIPVIVIPKQRIDTTLLSLFTYVLSVL